MRLSTLANPGDRMIEIGMKGFEAGIAAELRKSPEDAALYAANPGLLEAISAAGRPVVRKYLTASIPTRQQRFARFYADKFSAEEIDQLAFFYASPTGRKAIAAAYSGTNMDQLVSKMDTHKDGNLTAKDVSELNGAAVQGLPDQFDAEDWKALFSFAVTAVHAKLLKLAPEFSQLVADMENEADPAMDAELDKAVQAAVQAYMVKRNKK